MFSNVKIDNGLFLDGKKFNCRRRTGESCISKRNGDSNKYICSGKYFWRRSKIFGKTRKNNKNNKNQY